MLSLLAYFFFCLFLLSLNHKNKFYKGSCLFTKRKEIKSKSQHLFSKSQDIKKEFSEMLLHHLQKLSVCDLKVNTCIPIIKKFSLSLQYCRCQFFNSAFKIEYSCLCFPCIIREIVICNIIHSE